MATHDVVIDIAYVLDKLYYSATDEHDKGDKFERLVRKFLLTEPLHADRFDEVWRWTEWPDRGNRPDHGIDLVARERDTGDLVAVQCKFYDPTHYLTKGDIDSFLAESGKHPFRSRLVVSTTEKWNSAAEAAVQNQQIPVSRIGLADLAESTIDWTQFDFDTPDVLATKDRKRLHPHQRTALEKVRAGFVANDRGQMIMACGTGKTFTSLRIAEDLVPPGGHVLFLVPSIALASQALKEWSAEAEVSLRTFAVCSDSKVGKSEEDISVVDLAIPATTDPAKLAARAGDGTADARVTVVFSTYQSIDVISAAQRDHGLPAFDLVICDEAHRTTGVTLAGEERSAFTAVHDDTHLRVAKRLYMTATPRLYDDNSKAKAGEANALLASMDDETTFGPEFYRLGFGQAVSAGLLTDYKVLVLTVDEGAISATFQRELETNGELNLPDVARIVGCWNALAKRMSDDSFAADPEPMRRAVAFANTIASSKRFSAAFEAVVATYTEAIRIAGEEPEADMLSARVHHVDGTMNMLAREHEMDWLKGKAAPTEARVLTNAKCLSEGVDVPALDAVMFLHPRKSVVDVVQSVGRVMRLAPGKQYGYIILPIAVPAGMAPEEALRDNERFRVVWEVLQALRAHDERFDALVNQIDLNTKKPDKVSIFHVGPSKENNGEPADTTPSKPVAVQPTFQLDALEDWREAIYARMVEKVGSRQYWETWAKSVADIVDRHTTRLRDLIAHPSDPEVTARFEDFVAALRANLNDSITTDAAIDMLSQHMVTRPVFDALFPGYSFTDHNPVARVMQDMLRVLEGSNLDAETEALEGFYDSVRVRAEGIDNAAGKQRVIKELYEKFFRLAFPKSADALGIVYTPTEIVDFILRSVDDLLRSEFDTTISAEGVHVLDPFTGTGTFITRLLASGLIAPADLARKYASELHANELLLLAYYIAAANIEATYRDLALSADGPADGDGWVPFDGIVLADTLQMTEHDDTLDGHVFATNSERAERQLDLDIRVIVGNPPYSVGQSSGNDNNANLKYPTLDAKIEATYASRSTATLKNSLYDSYIRAIRWASDRIGDAGIIGFVTNGGFIDGNTADGLRKTLSDEFATIYIYNLRGNSRMAGDPARREGGNVFNVRVGIAITVLVRLPGHVGPATVRYHDIGDYLTREAKLDLVNDAGLATIVWQAVTPNAAGDWINQRGDEFDTYQPLGDKDAPGAVFALYSGGVKTNRDAWVYNFSTLALRENVTRMVDFYNAQVEAFAPIAATTHKGDLPRVVERFIDTDPAKFSWDRADRQRLPNGRHYELRDQAVRGAAYRPFTRQAVWFDRELNNTVYRVPAIFPTPEHPNVGFYVLGVGATAPFALLAVIDLPDVQMIGAGQNGQFFSRYTYERVVERDIGTQGGFDLSDSRNVVHGYRQVDNITDHTLATYRRWYGEAVVKGGIFAFVYGLLHSPEYRSRFAADLKRSLPRIPRIEAADFEVFRDAGRALLDLHIGYEEVAPFPLEITGENPQGPGSADLYGWFAVEKMRWGGTAKAKDRSTIVYNPRITVSGIPESAYEYMLGSRSALEWILDRYQVRVDKPSGIRNDPNGYSREVGNPRYILDLIAKVTTVSVRTVEIVSSLPALRIAEDQS